MDDLQQNRVAKTVWPWATPPGEDVPGGISPRKKVTITTPIAYAIAGLLYLWLDHLVGPILVVVIATSIAFCGFFIPPAYAAIERFFLRFAVWVAAALTWILLVPVFYMIFFPAGIFLTLRGKDPMERACPTDKPTYWSKRPPITRVNYYERQH
jgi:hypothetical protein